MDILTRASLLAAMAKSIHYYQYPGPALKDEI